MLRTLLAIISVVFTGCGNAHPLVPPPTMSSFPSQATVIVPIYPGSVNSGATAFGTNPLSIPKGTLVVWINYDTLDHTITSDTGVWDSGVRHHGQNYSYSFDTAGTYPYHDTLYGPAAMSGVITVAP